MATPPAVDILGQGLGQPAEFVWLITPSDSDELRFVTRAIRVGTAGDLAVKSASGDTVIIPDVLAGETLAIRVRVVFSTSTTASGIMGYA